MVQDAQGGLQIRVGDFCSQTNRLSTKTKLSRSQEKSVTFRQTVGLGQASIVDELEQELAVFNLNIIDIE